MRSISKILSLCFYFAVAFQGSSLSLARAGLDTQSTWHLHKAMQVFSGYYRPYSSKIDSSQIQSQDQILLDGTTLLKVSTHLLNEVPNLVIHFVGWSGETISSRPYETYSNQPTQSLTDFFRLSEASEFEIGNDFLIIRYIANEQFFSRILSTPLWFARPVKSLQLRFSIEDGKKQLEIQSYGTEGRLLKRFSDKPYKIESLCETLLR